MLSSGSPASTEDVRCRQEQKRPFTISSGQIDLDFGSDLDNPIPNTSVARSKSSSLLNAHLQHFNRTSQTYMPQKVRGPVIVNQPMSTDLDLIPYNEQVETAPQFAQDDSDLDLRLPSDIEPEQTYDSIPSDRDTYARFRYYSEDIETFNPFQSNTNTTSLPIYCYPLQALGDDNLVVIDGQIAVRDSNVDPILCRLRRQQVVSLTRRKESSVPTELLEAELVRFDRNIDIRQYDKEEDGESNCWQTICCFCCSKQEQPPVKELGPSDSILVTGTNRKSTLKARKSSFTDLPQGIQNSTPL